MRKIINFFIIIGIIPGIYLSFFIIGLILGLPLWIYILLFHKGPQDWISFELLLLPWGCFLLSLKYIIDWDQLFQNGEIKMSKTNFNEEEN